MLDQNMWSECSSQATNQFREGFEAGFLDISPKVARSWYESEKDICSLGLGLRVWGLVFRVLGLGFRFQGLMFRDQC